VFDLFYLSFVIIFVKISSTTESPHVSYLLQSARKTAVRSTVNMIGFMSFSVESGNYPTSCPTGRTGNFLKGKVLKHENLYNTVGAIHFSTSFFTLFLVVDITLNMLESRFTRWKGQ